jgi:hypothetical protein
LEDEIYIFGGIGAGVGIYHAPEIFVIKMGIILFS